MINHSSIQQTDSEWLVSLLKENSQFKRDELRFNHEALALWLKQFKEDHAKDQVFNVGGPADLYALLSRLQFDMVGDEVFIFIRPYIHSMLIYLRLEGDEICCFIFDSQNWGLRYYPTRLIIEALVKYFPANCHIYLSGTTVQSQENNRGCTEYSLACLNYLSEYGNQFFKAIRRMPASRLEHPWLQVDTVYQLAEDALPEKLFAQLQQAPETYQQNLAKLNELLASKYTHIEGIDWRKVYDTVDEMQGCLLYPVSYESSLYVIDVDLEKSQVTVKLPHKDHLRSNFLGYSSEVFPKDVSLKNLKFLLGDILDVAYDSTTQTLTFSLEDITQLPTILAKINVTHYFKQHMRQRLALNVFRKQLIECLQDALELHEIQQDKRGGFDTRQVQLALKNLFSPYKSKVYVPNFKILCEGQFDLDQFTDYSYIIFSMPVNIEAMDNRHQVAIWVALSKTGHRVEIFDPLYSKENFEKVEKILKEKLQSTQPIEYKQADLSEAEQTDDWSCGSRCIHALCKLANAHIEDCHFPVLSLDKANLSFLTKEYYAAFKRQAKLEEKFEEREVQNSHALRALLEGLSEIKPSFFERKTDNILLTQLEEFLLLVDIMREYCSYGPEYRVVSLQQLSENYRKQYPDDQIGYRTVMIAALYAGDSENLKVIMQKLIPYLLLPIEMESSLFNKMNLLCAHQFAMHLDQQSSVRQQLHFIKSILNLYLNSEESDPTELIHTILGTKLELFDNESEESFNRAIQIIHTDPVIQLALLTRVIVDTLATLIPTLQSKESRLVKLNSENELKLAEEELKRKAETVKTILHTAGLDIDISACMQLAKNTYALNFIYHYIRGCSDYFAKCSLEEAMQHVNEIAQLSSHVSLYSALTIYFNIQKINSHHYPTLKDAIPRYIDAIRPTIEDIDGDRSGISNGEIKKLLNEAPEEERFLLLLCLDRYVSNLSILLGSLPDHERKFAVEQLPHLITSSSKLAAILEQLPDDEKLPTLDIFAHLVTNSCKLYKVLDVFPKDKRLPIALKFMEKILNSGTPYFDFEVTTILALLPEQDKSVFAIQAKDCCGGSPFNDSFSEILFVLRKAFYPDLALCQTFALECEDKIVTYRELMIGLHYLDQDKQLDFALRVFRRLLNQQCDPFDYRKLNYLPLDILLKFFEWKGLDNLFIKKLRLSNVEQLLSLRELAHDPKILVKFVSVYTHLIANEEILQRVLEAMPQVIQEEIKEKWHKKQEQVRKKKLTDIRTIRPYFDYGYLKITPKNCQRIAALAKENKDLFSNFKGNVFLKKWQEADDLKALFHLLRNFNKIKKFRAHCGKGKVAEIIGQAVKFYSDLTDLDLHGCELTDAAMENIAVSLAHPENLKEVDVSSNHLSPGMVATLQQKFSNPQVKIQSDFGVFINRASIVHDLTSLGVLYMSIGESRVRGRYWFFQENKDYVFDANFIKALMFFKKAAQEGGIDALYHWGVMYKNGWGIYKNLGEAFKCFHTAAHQGHKDAQNILGCMYVKGEGIPEDFKEAFEWFKKAADQGNVDAYYNLGIMYKNGWNVETNEDEAIKWFQKAVDQGHRGAEKEILEINFLKRRAQKRKEKESPEQAPAGSFFRNNQTQMQPRKIISPFISVLDGATDIPNLAKQTSQLPRIVAVQNNQDLRDNQGIIQNDQRAIQLNQQAAQRRKAQDLESQAMQGNAAAQNSLGRIYVYGEGVPKDFQKAFHWFQAAAAQGDRDAQGNLGVLYKNGWGVEKDEKMAFEYFQKAAAQDNRNAQHNLGLMYMNGWGVEKDDKKAFEWLHKAADLGNIGAYYNLGIMYKNGWGVEKDEAEAIKCFQYAANRGHIGGCKQIKLLERIAQENKEKESEMQIVIDSSHDHQNLSKLSIEESIAGKRKREEEETEKHLEEKSDASNHDNGDNNLEHVVKKRKKVEEETEKHLEEKPDTSNHDTSNNNLEDIAKKRKRDEENTEEHRKEKSDASYPELSNNLEDNDLRDKKKQKLPQLTLGFIKQEIQNTSAATESRPFFISVIDQVQDPEKNNKLSEINETQQQDITQNEEKPPMIPSRFF